MVPVRLFGYVSLTLAGGSMWQRSEAKVARGSSGSRAGLAFASPLRVILLALGGGILASSCKETTEPPPDPVPTTISLNKTTIELDAITATEQLTATVLDQNGNTMAGQAVTWSSSNQPIATVSSTGLVAAVANGSATITAQAGSASAQANVTVAQVVTQLAKVTGDGQSGEVGQVLPDAVEVELRDRLGNAVPGGAGGAVANAVINFAVTVGGGSVAASNVNVDPAGRAGTTWMLGTTAGDPQSVSATLAGGSISTSFNATALPGPADSVEMVSGDGQTGSENNPLPDSLVVRVLDTFGNPVPGHDIAWVVTAGGGSTSPDTNATGIGGEAFTFWTVGMAGDPQQLEARAGAGVAGSPVVFLGTAIQLTVTAVSPDTIVENGSATIDGNGFDPDPASNTVMIGGLAATVTAASTTQLTVTVPTFDCLPARDVNIQVTVGGASTNPVSHPLQPAAFTELATGEFAVLQDPAGFCLQFRPAAVGEQYIVGVGAAAESPTSFMTHTMTAETGANLTPAPPVVSAAAPSVTATLATTAPPRPELLEQRMHHLRAESQLREWERMNLDPRRNPGVRFLAQPAPAAPAVVPTVGDTLTFRVPDVSGNPCNFNEITTVVRVVGSAGIFVADTANPATDSLTLAELQAYSDTFDIHIFDVDTTYFGTPSDLDTNDRVFVVLTIEVNKFPQGFAGFVFGGDLVDRTQCASSDRGEIFYGHVPDPNNEAGTGPRSKSAVLGQMASLIAHEFTHNIQVSRRQVVLGSNTFLTSWEAEGQATLAEEVVGHSVLGNQPSQNYGSATARGMGAGDQWYEQAFLLLALYFGWDRASGTVVGAPEECTLFGSVGLGTPCNTFHFYGASWSFQRFVSDHFGPGFAGGEAEMHFDWINANPNLNGTANVEAVLGVQFDSLFARWGATLYADDRAVAVDSLASMLSWNLFDIYESFGTDIVKLRPRQRSFTAFSDTLDVRGGSTAFALISSTADRPATAIRVRDGTDTVLGTGMKPQLWIVRLQ